MKTTAFIFVFLFTSIASANNFNSREDIWKKQNACIQEHVGNKLFIDLFNKNPKSSRGYEYKLKLWNSTGFMRQKKEEIINLIKVSWSLNIRIKVNELSFKNANPVLQQQETFLYIYHFPSIDIQYDEETQKYFVEQIWNKNRADGVIKYESTQADSGLRYAHHQLIECYQAAFGL